MGLIDPRSFRDALGCYASGITIISGIAEGVPLGFTCQSFYSVSLEPPLVSFSVMRRSSRWPRIRAAGRFAVNVLAAHQAGISTALGRSDPDVWASVEWTRSPEGNPVLSEALVRMDCTISDEHVAGDHWIVVANVTDLLPGTSETSGKPLLYYRGGYHGLV